MHRCWEKGTLAQAEQPPFLAPERAASETAHEHPCNGSEMQHPLFGRVIQHFVWVHLWEHTDPLKEVGTLVVFAEVMVHIKRKKKKKPTKTKHIWWRKFPLFTISSYLYLNNLFCVGKGVEIWFPKG